MNLLPIMGDVQVAFWILTHHFVQWPSYLLWCTFLLFTFIESFIYFDSFFLQMFGHLLGLRSFDNLEGPLACKQASIPITFTGIRFISIAAIIPTTYLGSWALIVLIITIRFMIDQRPFLLQALAQVNNITFLSNTSRWHVISYCPQFAHVFFHLNNSLGNKWFDFKIPSWSICTIIPFQHALKHDSWSPSCPNSIMFWPRGRCLVYSSTNPFELSINFPDLFIVLRIWLGLAHPLIAGILDACAHIASTLWLSIFYVVFMAISAHEPMMQFVTPLLPLHRMLASMWGENNYMFFFQTCSIFPIDESTLCSLNMAFTP